MKKQIKNFNQFYKKSIIIYYSILFGLLILLSVVYFQVNVSSFSINESKEKIAISFMITFIVLGSIFKIEKNIIQKSIKKKLLKKIIIYQKVFIVKIFIIELVAIMNIILYLYTSNKIFLIFMAISLLYILMIKPNPDKMIIELQLNDDEKTYIENPEKLFLQ